MTEIQEQNSKSEDMKPETIEAVVESLATPYRAIIPIPKEDLQILFDSFWEQHADDLIRLSGYKGKKSKGGKVDPIAARKSIESKHGLTKLYGPGLSHWAEEVLDAQYSSLNEKVMHVYEVKLDKYDTDEPVVICFFYFWPRLNFFDKLNFELERSHPREPEKALEGRMKDLQNQYKYYEPTEVDEIAEDMEVLVDIIAQMDGEPYDRGTVRQQWYRVQDLVSKQLKGSILEHKKGDLFEVSFPNPMERVEEGEEPKLVTAHVKIYDSRYPKVYDVDDPKLYEVSKFETKEQFIEQFNKEYDEYMTNAERHHAFDEIINQLTMKGKLEPIPQMFIDAVATNFLNKHLESFKGDREKAYKSVGATSEEHYMRMGQSQVIKDIINRMAVRSYAVMYDLSDEPEVVAEHILSQVKWVEPSK